MGRRNRPHIKPDKGEKMSDTKYGGPSTSKETCKKCGDVWERYRGGSYDWEYKDCFKCRMYQANLDGDPLKALDPKYTGKPKSEKKV